MNQNTQSPNPFEERATDFSNWLQALLRANERADSTQFAGENTRGILAALRSGLGEERNRLWPYVAPFLLEEPRDSDQWFFTVGALAGWHPKARPHGAKSQSLGQTAHEFKEKSASLNIRFATLLACNERDLAGHLRHVVGLLRAQDVAVDYRTLLRDLVVIGWRHPEKPVQQKWARDFYRSPRDTTPDDAATSTASDSELSSEI